MILKTEEQNYHIKERGIPLGCQYCLKGAKAVLFLNGVCQNPSHCSWYCPISEKRKNKRETYVNEIKISEKSELFEELSKTDAEGLSITGGEPLFAPNLPKTLEYIELIKKAKGSDFHIHLYTNGCHFNEKIGKRLAKAGLDEIRFHPPKDKWNVVEQALNKGMDVGAEVPVIPTESYEDTLREFILYLDKVGADFINLNEFEYCFPNSKELRARGFSLKKGTIASVKKSKDTALRIMNELAPKTKLKIHFCSIKAKDYYQLKERYFRRARNIKTPYEEVTEEGLLLYGKVEGGSEELKGLHSYLRKESGMPPNLIFFAPNGICLPYYVLMDDSFLDFLKQFDLEGYIVEALPFNRGEEEQYRQITEKTPISVFKKEMDNYEG